MEVGNLREADDADYCANLTIVKNFKMNVSATKTKLKCLQIYIYICNKKLNPEFIKN